MERLNEAPLVLSFLVERYWPGVTSEKLERAVARMRDAADALSREGTQVRYVRSTLMPADEVVLSYFEAPSRGVVEEANRRTGIRFDRITEATDVAEERRPNGKE